MSPQPEALYPLVCRSVPTCSVKCDELLPTDSHSAYGWGSEVLPMPRTTKDHLRGKRVATVEVREEAGNRQGKRKEQWQGIGGGGGREGPGKDK